MTMTEFVEEAYVNEFGQKIEPGEEILYAGSSQKSTSIRKAFFKGVRYADVTSHNYLKDENGNYIKEDYVDRWAGRTFQRHKTETKTTREVVSVVVRSNRGKQYKWTTGPDGKKAYVKTDEDVYGTSILPLKRIYKFSTNLSELAGQSF
jgi:hypothetical protein